MPTDVERVLSVLREPLCCPECRKILGETIGHSLFVSILQHRVFVGPLPSFIVCEDCGGVWRNADMPEGLPAMMAAFRSFIGQQPRGAIPERNWDAVPNERRDRAHRQAV